MDQTARTIAEAILEITGRALDTGDAKRFVDCFRIPLSVVTDLGKRVVDDPMEIRATFDRVRWHYRASGITHLDRVCVAAEFLERNVVLSVHETHMYRDSALTQDPFLTMSELNYDEGEWRIRYCNYAIPDSLRHQRALYGPNPIGSLRALRGD